MVPIPAQQGPKLSTESPAVDGKRKWCSGFGDPGRRHLPFRKVQKPPAEIFIASVLIVAIFIVAAMIIAGDPIIVTATTVFTKMIVARGTSFPCAVHDGGGVEFGLSRSALCEGCTSGELVGTDFRYFSLRVFKSTSNWVVLVFFRRGGVVRLLSSFLSIKGDVNALSRPGD